MKGPHIKHTLLDDKRGVEYVVMAYRKLNRSEILAAVRLYLSQRKRKPKQGEKVTILSTIGYGQ